MKVAELAKEVKPLVKQLGAIMAFVEEFEKFEEFEAARTAALSDAKAASEHLAVVTDKVLQAQAQLAGVEAEAVERAASSASAAAEAVKKAEARAAELVRGAKEQREAHLAENERLRLDSLRLKQEIQAQVDELSKVKAQIAALKAKALEGLG